jgi:hypothetical protein
VTRHLYQFIVVLFLSLALPVQAATKADYEQALSKWALVLQTYVNEQGQTDFIALAKNPDDLTAYVNFVAKVSPSNEPLLFTSPAEVIAYHLNTYNALAMYGVISEGVPSDFDCFFKRLMFFKLRDMEIGGVITSLYDYENDVIRPLGEPRIHFALNCMVKDCPRLPQFVFKAEHLEQDLDDLTWAFFNKEKHLRIDNQNQRIYVSEILDFYTEDFVTSSEQQDLLAYINRYRSKKIPSDYHVEFIDYDWTINQQPNALIK